MRYINETLLQNERLVYVTKPHWIIFVWSALMILATLFAKVYGAHVDVLQFRIAGFYLYNAIAIVLFLVTLYMLGSAIIFYKTSEYAITDKRVLIKVGWIGRDALEIFLDKIEAVRIDQSIPGRILNYGTLAIIGTGGTQDAFPYVPDPLGFRKKVQQQLDLYEHPH